MINSKCDKVGLAASEIRNTKLISQLKNSKIGIMGFGIENQALVKWLIKHGIKDITICDSNPKLKTQNLKHQLGEKYLENLEQFDIVFRTPGISPLTPELVKAKKFGVEISSQIKLFFDLCPAKIIGVTGTKGKGTTTTLIYEILKLSNSKIYCGGNIGNAPIEFVDDLKKEDWVVLELSSFQLMDLQKSPNIAVVLDIKVDHLDYHKNREEYIESKQNIVRFQNKDDFTVINMDYFTSVDFAAASGAKNIYYFSRRKSVDLGTYVLWNSKKSDAHYGRIILKDEKGEHEICPTYDIILRGEHNLENICAAITAARLAGADIETIKKAIPKFKGLEHRLEFAGEINGIKFYNDSFSTTPDTAIAAIKSFSEPIILIAGGSEKGADYKELSNEITNSTVKTVIAIGETGKRIVSSIDNKIKIICDLKKMPEIIKAAVKEAKTGDVVLLSPASASFGLFKNYKDRGNQFKEEVNRIMSF